MALTEKNKEFCKKYLGECNFNATAAYKAVYGCTTRAAGSRGHTLLKNAETQAYLSSLRARIDRRSMVTLERTVEEIGRVAFSDITDMLSFDSEGVEFKASNGLTKDVTAAIASVKSSQITRYVEGESETRVEIQGKMHNKVSALGLLAQFFGITTDFNQARASLRRYGLELTEDLDSELGWRLEAYGASNSGHSSAEADQAAEDFFEDD